MSIEDVFHVLISQLRNNFCLNDREENLLNKICSMRGGYSETSECFAQSTCKYFNPKEGLNAFNSVIYCNFLYWVSRHLYKNGENLVADKVYYLNKMLNGVDLFYAIELPVHWSCEHPLGSVMGRAVYGDYFFFYQGCTVGGNHTNYPVIGKNVIMLSNSKILGKSNIGDNVILSANTYVKDMDIPNNSIVFGQYPDITIKQNKNTDKFWK